MKSDEIREIIDRLQSDKDLITAQVDAARRHAKDTGQYSDSTWLTKAELAGKIKGRQIFKLQAALGVAAREEKAERSAAAIIANNERSVPFERAFMRRAKALLPEALYDQILMETSLEPV